MLVTVDIPDQVAQHFIQTGESPSRELLEAYLLQKYAERKISGGWLGKALGMDFYEREQFLKDRGAPPSITSEELAEQVANLEKLLPE